MQTIRNATGSGHYLRQGRITLPQGSKSCARRNADCGRLPLEAHLKSILPELRVIKRTEERRGDISLYVGWQECVEGVIRANPDPRLQLANMKAVFQAQIESEVVGHP